MKAVVLPCRSCKIAVRVAFEEAAEPGGVPRDFKCPKCSAALQTHLNTASQEIQVSEFEPPKSNAGFCLADVQTDTKNDVVFYPVVLHHKDAAISLTLMWPEPLPEVLYIGSPTVRGYRLHTANPTFVLYSESEQLLRELHEHIKNKRERILRDGRGPES